MSTKAEIECAVIDTAARKTRKGTFQHDGTGGVDVYRTWSQHVAALNTAIITETRRAEQGWYA